MNAISCLRLFVAAVAVVAAPPVWANADGDFVPTPPPGPPLGDTRADAYVAQGDEYREAKNYAKAVEAFNKALRLQPSNAKAQFGLGITYYELKQWKRCIAALKKYLTLVAPSPAVVGLLGDAYLEADQYQQALESYGKALALDARTEKTTKHLYLGIGTAYNELRQHDKAASNLEEALKIDPEDARANYELGYAYYDLDRCEDALGPMERAARAHPNSADVQLGLGHVVLCLGKIDEARHVYEVLKPIDASAARHLYRDIEEEETARSKRASRPVAEASADEQPRPVDVVGPLLPVQFTSGTTKILDGSVGKQSLQKVAAFMAQRRDVKLLVQGHAHYTGNDATSMALSSRRAAAIRAQLVEMGVERERLVAIAFGSVKPIADNATAAGRARNDRVEFRIVEVNGRPSEDETDGGRLVP